MFERVERIRKQAIGEMIVDEIRRNRQQMRIVWIFDAITLQRAEIIGVSELGAQIFENLPVTIAARRANLFFQKSAQVARHAVVVEQRVIDVKKKNRFHHLTFGAILTPSALIFET